MAHSRADATVAQEADFSVKNHKKGKQEKTGRATTHGRNPKISEIIKRSMTMAAVTSKDIPTETAFFNDFWKVIKLTIMTEDNESYWQTVVDLTGKLTAKYPDNLFAEEMTISYLGYLEKAAKSLSAKTAT